MNTNLIRTITLCMLLSISTLSSPQAMSKPDSSSNIDYQETGKKVAKIDSSSRNASAGASIQYSTADEIPTKPIVVGVISVLIGMGVLIWSYGVIQKGKEYGLKFIFSLNFFFLFANFLILFCFVLSHLPEIGLVVYTLIWLFVFWRNARKSNYIFSLQYTLIQSISAILAIALFIFCASDDKARRKIKVRKLLNS